MYLQLCFLALQLCFQAAFTYVPGIGTKEEFLKVLANLKITDGPDDSRVELEEQSWKTESPFEFPSIPVNPENVYKETFGENVRKSDEYSSFPYRLPYSYDKNEYSEQTSEDRPENYALPPDIEHIFRYPEHFEWKTNKVYQGNSGGNVPNITQVPTHRTKVSYDCYKTDETGLSEYLPGVPEDNAVNYPEQFVWNASIVYQETYLPPPIGPPNYLCDKRHLDPIRVGSILEIPGLHFPNYKDIPLTSFSCSDKPYVPGYYADLETGCQVFHVCFENRKESFLCPLGTIFNQAVLTCDYWYSTNCSMTPHLYKLNARSQTTSKDIHSTVNDFETDKIISSSGKNEEMLPKTTVKYYDPLPDVPHVTDEFRRYSSRQPPRQSDLSHIWKLLPIKAKVSVYPVSKETKVEAVASIGSNGERKQWSIYQPITESKPKPSTYSRGIDPSISKIIDDAFDIARQVIDRAAGFIPRRESQNVKRKETSKTTLPRTKVNYLRPKLPEETFLAKSGT